VPAAGIGVRGIVHRLTDNQKIPALGNEVLPSQALTAIEALMPISVYTDVMPRFGTSPPTFETLFPSLATTALVGLVGRYVLRQARPQVVLAANLPIL